MSRLSDNFIIAVKDYRYLLERKYPQKKVLELVGTRYSLSAIERSMLFRGITTQKQAGARKSKSIGQIPADTSIMFIDGFNALLTIGSYLNGNQVYIAADGFLRDASEVHGKIFRTALVEKALRLIFEYLDSIPLSGSRIYIDEAVTHSEALYKRIMFLKQEYNIELLPILSEAVDHTLEKQKTGIIASSDSTIIDRAKTHIFDLPRHVLEFHFKPEFISLEDV